MSDVTELIHRAAVGDRAAFDAAYQHIHAELKSSAARRLSADHNRTLSATMLVNETWLKLAGSAVHAENRAHSDAELAELVELRVFSGLDLAEIAALRGVSERTVQRSWRSARAFLLNP